MYSEKARFAENLLGGKYFSSSFYINSFHSNYFFQTPLITKNAFYGNNSNGHLILFYQEFVFIRAYLCDQSVAFQIYLINKTIWIMIFKSFFFLLFSMMMFIVKYLKSARVITRILPFWRLTHKHVSSLHILRSTFETAMIMNILIN